ncbi:ribosomal biogenesis regulatory protein [Pyronema omphalodes]|nr:ribosomal biogenesis regulatory protein [Pyronema omphalodes]
MGNLVCFDTNPLDPETYKTDREACLNAVIREGAQAIINQVLTALTLKSTADGVFAELPEPVTPLPREKAIPKPREPTKWELFAKKKGITDKPRDGKLVYDEEKQEWVPKWGYKGKNKEVENQWLVEIDDTKKTEDGEEVNPRKLSREERKRNIKLNERQQKKNAQRSDAALGAKKAGVEKRRK